MQTALESSFSFLKDLHTGRTSALKWGTRRSDGREVVIKYYKSEAEAASEAALLAMLQPCINVCSLVQVLQLGPQQYTVLEPYPSDLHSLLRTHQAGLPSAEVRQLGAQILNALDFMHQRQVAYLALRPATVMLQPPPGAGLQGSVVKLIHFKQAQQLPAKGGVVVNHRPASMLRYDAPELLAGDACGTAADIFAFGCVLGEMILGRPLFTATQPRDMLASVIRSLGLPPPRMQAVMRRDPGLREVLTQLGSIPGDAPLEKRLAICQCDDDLRGAVMACLILDPEQRPTAKQLLRHVFEGVLDSPAFQQLQQRHQQRHQQRDSEGDYSLPEPGGLITGVSAMTQASMVAPLSVAGDDRLSPARNSPARPSPAKGASSLGADSSGSGGGVPGLSPSRRTSASGGNRVVKRAILAMPGLASPASAAAIMGGGGGSGGGFNGGFAGLPMQASESALRKVSSASPLNAAALYGGQAPLLQIAQQQAAAGREHSWAGATATATGAAGFAAGGSGAAWGQHGGVPLEPGLARARAVSDNGLSRTAQQQQQQQQQKQKQQQQQKPSGVVWPPLRWPSPDAAAAVPPADVAVPSRPPQESSSSSSPLPGGPTLLSPNTYLFTLSPPSPDVAAATHGEWLLPSQASNPGRPPLDPHRQPRLSDPGRALLARQASRGSLGSGSGLPPPARQASEGVAETHGGGVGAGARGGVLPALPRSTSRDASPQRAQGQQQSMVALLHEHLASLGGALAAADRQQALQAQQAQQARQQQARQLQRVLSNEGMSSSLRPTSAFPPDPNAVTPGARQGFASTSLSEWDAEAAAQPPGLLDSFSFPVLDPATAGDEGQVHQEQQPASGPALAAKQRQQHEDEAPEGGFGSTSLYPDAEEEEQQLRFSDPVPASQAEGGPRQVRFSEPGAPGAGRGNGPRPLANMPRGSEPGARGGVAQGVGAVEEEGEEEGLQQQQSGTAEMEAEVSRLRSKVRHLQLGSLKRRQAERQLERQLEQQQQQHHHHHQPEQVEDEQAMLRQHLRAQQDRMRALGPATAGRPAAAGDARASASSEPSQLPRPSLLKTRSASSIVLAPIGSRAASPSHAGSGSGAGPNSKGSPHVAAAVAAVAAAVRGYGAAIVAGSNGSSNAGSPLEGAAPHSHMLKPSHARPLAPLWSGASGGVHATSSADMAPDATPAAAFGRSASGSREFRRQASNAASDMGSPLSSGGSSSALGSPGKPPRPALPSYSFATTASRLGPASEAGTSGTGTGRDAGLLGGGRPLSGGLLAAAGFRSAGRLPLGPEQRERHTAATAAAPGSGAALRLLEPEPRAMGREAVPRRRASEPLVELGDDSGQG